MKQSIGIIGGILLFLIALAWGINKYKELQHAEKNYNTDLFSLIPENNDLFLYIDNFSRYKDELSMCSYFKANKSAFPVWDRFFSENIDTWCNNNRLQVKILERNLIITAQSADPENSALYLFKLNKEEDKLVDHFLETYLFPDFKPVTEVLNGYDIRYYSLPGGKFFCCVIHNDFFAGTLDRKQIDYIINRDSTSEKQLEKLIHKGNKHKSTSLFVKDNNLWDATDISFASDRMIMTELSEKQLSGYPVFNQQKPVEILTDSIYPEYTLSVLNYGISDYSVFAEQNQYYIPDSLFSDNDKQLATNLAVNYFKEHFNENIYHVHFRDTSGLTQQIVLMQLKDSTQAFNCFIRDIKKTSALRALNYRGVNNKLIYIYKFASPGFICDAFGEKMNMDKEFEYVTIQNNYMLISDSINTLTLYLSDYFMKKTENDKNPGYMLNNDFNHSGNGIIWINKAKESDIPEKAVYRYLYPVENCTLGIQWAQEEELIYRNTVLYTNLP